MLYTVQFRLVSQQDVVKDTLNLGSFWSTLRMTSPGESLGVDRPLQSGQNCLRVQVKGVALISVL